jgi:hypothetical protein
MAESKRFLLRLDPGLFETLRRWAQDDVRSINGQIEYLLADSARRAGRLPHRETRPSGADPSPADDDAAGDGADDPGAVAHPVRGISGRG